MIYYLVINSIEDLNFWLQIQTWVRLWPLWFIQIDITIELKRNKYVMSILQDYDAFFLFSLTFGANHDNPSTNPSPFTAQQAWMYQSWLRMLRKSSFSVISEGEAAFGKSCLFAKMSNMEFLKRSSWIKSWSSSLTSTNLSLSQESTTQIRASLFSK